MRKAANSNKIIKQANEYLVLAVLLKNDPLSVEEIVTLSRLSRPTVLNILKELDTRGLIYRAGLGESMGGRQPIMYTLNLRRYFAVGVDLEYPPVRVAFSDLREKVLYSQEWDCLPGETMEDIEENLVNAIRKGMRRLNIATENLIGIGLGIPGRVDIARNLAVRMDRMDHIWQGGDIAAQLSMKLGVPVTVRNDIHLLAAAERTVQPALPKNFLYVARRVGIGMAVFLNGKSYEGGFGNSGYLGHTVLDPEGPACRCGQRGCLECYATTGAVEINYARGAERPADYGTIVSRAQEGEPLAMAVLGDAGIKLAMAVVNAMLLYDIQTVIIEDCVDDGTFFAIVRENIEKLLGPSSDFQPRVLRGKLTGRTFALGGCSMIVKNFFKAPQLKVDG